jgi:hypothetical protein
MLRPIASFTTDETGQPVSLPSLEASSTFVICHDEEVPPIRAMESREAVARWIDECVLGDLRTLRLGIERVLSQFSFEAICGMISPCDSG